MIPALAFAKPALGFLGRHWQLAAIGVLALLLALAKGDVRHWKKQAGLEHDARIELVAKYHNAAQLANSWVRERNAAIEKNQSLVSVEVIGEYHAKLDDLRARHNAMLLRWRKAANDLGRAGEATPASIPDTPSRANETTPAAELHYIRITPEQALTAEEIRLQLIGLQSWVAKQAAIER